MICCQWQETLAPGRSSKNHQHEKEQQQQQQHETKEKKNCFKDLSLRLLGHRS
jgi:hypothetical protein